jgi:hypothetical protein
MWKPIDSTEILREISKGYIVSDSLSSKEYKVKDIGHNGYVIVMNLDQRTNEVKMFPSANLIKGKWWVKE